MYSEESADIEIWDGEGDEEDEIENDQWSIVSEPVLKILKLVCLFFLTWQAIFKIPDAAIQVVLKFMRAFLLKLAAIHETGSLKQLHEIFPQTLEQARKLESIDRNDFKKMVICSKCHSTYLYEDCLNSTKCSYVRFPQHSQKRMRKKCDYSLVKLIKTATGKQIERPLKIFCYKSVIVSIEKLAKQPGMIHTLNHWNNRNIPDGILADIYDGKVWKAHLNINGKDFLNSRYCIAMLINIDWFQPFKHVQYSVGAIYLAILNLPRQVLYRRENVILVGIMPGPHEPRLTVSSYLEPLVLDLQKLWRGVDMVTTEGKQTVNALLICNASDVPACRKVGGFVGHGALKACSRCLKSFPTSTFGEKADYSGFERLNWPQRLLQDHQQKGMAWKHAKSQADRVKIEREFGVRFTELLRLPYFNTIQFSIIDPMHNMLLGTAKHMLAVWKECKILTPEHLDAIQSLIDQFIVPSDIGRIPHKIASSFSSFTADQWKNWTLIFSLVAMKKILPQLHFDNWHSFVKACSFLCSRAITVNTINEFDTHIMYFCNTFNSLYGSKYCTPNIHFSWPLKRMFRRLWTSKCILAVCV